MREPSFKDTPAHRRPVLRANWQVLRSVLPHAMVGRKYNIDCVLIEGVVVGGLKGFANHNSYFPYSGGVLRKVKTLPKGYSTTAGALRIPVDAVIPRSLMQRLVRIRLDEMANASRGKRVVTFPNGRVKAVGTMRRGKLHGKWSWFRADGSLMRTGSFRDGLQTGTWTTYDRRGRVVTTKTVRPRVAR